MNASLFGKILLAAAGFGLFFGASLLAGAGFAFLGISAGAAAVVSYISTVAASFVVAPPVIYALSKSIGFAAKKLHEQYKKRVSPRTRRNIERAFRILNHPLIKWPLIALGVAALLFTPLGGAVLAPFTFLFGQIISGGLAIMGGINSWLTGIAFANGAASLGVFTSALLTSAIETATLGLMSALAVGTSKIPALIERAVQKNWWKGWKDFWRDPPEVLNDHDQQVRVHSINKDVARDHKLDMARAIWSPIAGNLTGEADKLVNRQHDGELKWAEIRYDGVKKKTSGAARSGMKFSDELDRAEREFLAAKASVHLRREGTAEFDREVREIQARADDMAAAARTEHTTRVDTSASQLAPPPHAEALNGVDVRSIIGDKPTRKDLEKAMDAIARAYADDVGRATAYVARVELEYKVVREELTKIIDNTDGLAVTLANRRIEADLKLAEQEYEQAGGDKLAKKEDKAKWQQAQDRADERRRDVKDNGVKSDEVQAVVGDAHADRRKLDDRYLGDGQNKGELTVAREAGDEAIKAASGVAEQKADEVGTDAKGRTRPNAPDLREHVQKLANG